MQRTINTVAIVGGGTAGWLSAAVIAAHHKTDRPHGLKILLIESSDIPTVGVGEGTWPTMKNTVKSIGIKERDLFKKCHAAFKQGGKFVDWVNGDGDFYYHPFTVPLGYGRIDLAPYVAEIEDFAVAANFQHHVCEAGLAPRGLSDGEYQGQCNYAYHLDAGAFAELLKDFSKKELGVEHIIGTVEDATLSENGDIECIVLDDQRKIHADLFVDCTGFRSLLLGDKLGVPFLSKDDVLFNDSALALHFPYPSDQSPVASHTIAAAQNAGWIWDIGLPSRRGVGHVYAGEFLSDDEALANLKSYLGPEAKDIEPRKIQFNSGHRETFWKNNCVAVGMSAGFVEPLEATAIMLVEISARYIAENLPPNQEIMQVTAKRFNQQMDYRWSRVIDFLKLHYMLSKRPEPYWEKHRDPESFPETLVEDLAVWGYRGPVAADFDSAIELFPAASYQYVLYGMGFKPDFDQAAHLYADREKAEQIIAQNKTLTQQLLTTLPPHRQYIDRWLSA